MRRHDYEDCLREGLLRRIPPSREMAEGSVGAAKRWLDEAETGLRSGALNSSVLSSYLAMFHSARAILFRDGYRERSHYCVARYLEERYVKRGHLEARWVELLDHHRETRHASQYDVSFHSSTTEATNALETARRFVERLKALFDALYDVKDT
ncbi:MAG: HEPN domain-containing protein [Candidatus Bathyarchaeota archaeon]|nr:HEPN domain-containing protein [Candidatus Bathyarchaeota archaeon]